jgi:hypothetical protein
VRAIQSKWAPATSETPVGHEARVEKLTCGRLSRNTECGRKNRSRRRVIIIVVIGRIIVAEGRVIVADGVAAPDHAEACWNAVVGGAVARAAARQRQRND